MNPPDPADVETVLRHLHPEKYLLDPLVAGLKGLAAVKGLPDPSDEFLASMPEARKLQETRQRLLAMSAEEVAHYASQAKAVQAARDKAKAEALEAARFYNQRAAFADFAFWAEVENWSPDDSVALLLGRDPRVVSPDTLAAELKTGTRVPNLGKVDGRAAFHRQFDDLQTLLRRSDALSAPLLKPQAVLTWARTVAAITMPPGLASALESKVNALQLPSTEQTVWAPGAMKRWPPERLATLAAVKATKGTKATAEQFGISEARVRKLLPSEVEPTAGVQNLPSWPPRPKRPRPRR